MTEFDSTTKPGESLKSTSDTTSIGPSRNRSFGSKLALLEVVICSGFPTQLALALFLSGLGITGATPDGQLSFTYVIILSLADTAILLSLIIYFLSTHGESIRDLVVGVRPVGREAVLGVLLIPLLVLSTIGGLLLIEKIAPALRNVPDNPLESMLNTPERAILFGVVAVIAGGIREELQRAFILRRFEQHLCGAWIGLVIFSVAFGLGHYVQGWDAALITAALGMVWGVLYLMRRTVVASMVSHAGFNLTEILLVLTASQTM